MRAGLAPGFPLSVRVRLMNKGSRQAGYSTRLPFGPTIRLLRDSGSPGSPCLGINFA
jgi:hypothetical protein